MRVRENMWPLHPGWLTQDSSFFGGEVDTNLPIMAMLTSEVFTTAKKVTSNGIRPDDHWIKSLMFILLSWPGICL